MWPRVEIGRMAAACVVINAGDDILDYFAKIGDGNNKMICFKIKLKY